MLWHGEYDVIRVEQIGYRPAVPHFKSNYGLTSTALSECSFLPLPLSYMDSKMSSCVALFPVYTTHAKGDRGNAWESITESENERQRNPVVSAGYKPNSRILWVLNDSPKVEARLYYQGCYPEVSFTSPDGCFIMGGEEFMYMVGCSEVTRSTDLVRLERTEKGYRLARYEQTVSDRFDLPPKSELEMDKETTERLKSMSLSMCAHSKIEFSKESSEADQVQGL